MKNKFYIIYEWMLTELKLSGSELLVFALIYSICTNNEKCYPSQRYISDMTGLSKRTVIYSLSKLIDNHFIEKKREKGNTYKITDEVKNKCAEFALLKVQNLHQESAKIAPNIIVDNIVDNTSHIDCAKGNNGRMVSAPTSCCDYGMVSAPTNGTNMYHTVGVGVPDDPYYKSNKKRKQIDDDWGYIY